MEISISTGPTWTEVLTAVGTAGLFVVAIIAAVLALRQLRLMDGTERRKLTFSLVRDYTTATLLKDYAAGTDVSLSPMQAYTNLITPPTIAIPKPGEPVTIRNYVGETIANYYVLRNYLDEVDDLYQRNLIDREFYLNRHSHVIADAIVALRRFAPLVAGSGADTELLGRLEKIAHDFDSRREPQANAPAD